MFFLLLAGGLGCHAPVGGTTGPSKSAGDTSVPADPELTIDVEYNAYNPLSFYASVSSSEDATVAVEYQAPGQHTRRTPSRAIEAGTTETFLVLGLRQQTTYVVQPVVGDAEADWNDDPADFTTATLPDNWPACEVVTSKNASDPQVEQEVACTNLQPGGAYVCFDREGQIVWAVQEPDTDTIHAFQPLRSGNLAMVSLTRSVATIVSPGGEPQAQYTPAFFTGETRFQHDWIDHHEIIEIADGQWKGAVAVLTAATEQVSADESEVGPGILVFNPDTGEVLWDWSLLGYDLTDGQTIDHAVSFDDVGMVDENGDWAHANALLHRVEDGHDVFWMSLRFLDEIIKIDASTDAIDWRLGYGRDFNLVDDLDATAPQAVDRETGWMFQMHGPEWEASEDGRTTVLLYDNGMVRPDGGTSSWSRIVEYEVDEDRRMAELIWSWGSDDPESDRWFESREYGNATMSHSGDRVFFPDATDDPAIVEVSYPDGEATWKLVCPGVEPFYRVAHYASVYEMAPSVY